LTVAADFIRHARNDMMDKLGGYKPPPRKQALATLDAAH
jgi:hypothetical protein